MSFVWMASVFALVAEVTDKPSSYALIFRSRRRRWINRDQSNDDGSRGR